MTKKSRNFEKLVSRIEQALLKTPAIVKSPDYIKDKDSGELREVDASITSDVGSSRIIITIEDRDRKSKKAEDVRWIEELAQKKQSIGANHTIAVSSTGFYIPAQKKASALGIDLRKVSELTGDEFKSWLATKGIYSTVVFWGVKETEIEIFGELDKDEVLEEGYSRALEEKKFDAPFVFDKHSSPISVTQLLHIWELKSGQSFTPRQKMVMGEKHEHAITQKLEPGVFWVSTNKGRRQVAAFTILLSVRFVREFRAFTSYLNYEKDGSSIAQIAQANLYDNYNIELHRDTNTGQIKLGIYKQE